MSRWIDLVPLDQQVANSDQRPKRVLQQQVPDLYSCHPPRELQEDDHIDHDRLESCEMEFCLTSERVPDGLLVHMAAGTLEHQYLRVEFFRHDRFD